MSHILALNTLCACFSSRQIPGAAPGSPLPRDLEPPSLDPDGGQQLITMEMMITARSRIFANTARTINRM